MEPVNLNQILETAILAVLTPTIPLLLAWLKKWIDAKLGQEQQATILAIARLAVLATEQAGLGGPEAKNHATRLAQSALAAQKIKVDGNDLSMVIEGLVMDEFNRYRQLPPPSDRAATAQPAR